jgi:hypothetical protein
MNEDTHMYEDEDVKWYAVVHFLWYAVGGARCFSLKRQVKSVQDKRCLTGLFLANQQNTSTVHKFYRASRTNYKMLWT